MNGTFESLRLCRKDVASAAFVVKTIAQHRQRVCAINAVELSTYWEALAEGAGAIPALENIELCENLELSEWSEAENHEVTRPRGPPGACSSFAQRRAQGAQVQTWGHERKWMAKLGGALQCIMQLRNGTTARCAVLTSATSRRARWCVPAASAGARQEWHSDRPKVWAWAPTTLPRCLSSGASVRTEVDKAVIKQLRFSAAAHRACCADAARGWCRMSERCRCRSGQN